MAAAAARRSAASSPDPQPSGAGVADKQSRCRSSARADGGPVEPTSSRTPLPPRRHSKPTQRHHQSPQPQNLAASPRGASPWLTKTARMGEAYVSTRQALQASEQEPPDRLLSKFLLTEAQKFGST